MRPIRAALFMKAAAPGSGPHRYWRMTLIDLPGGSDLEISELQVYEGASDVTALATKTASNSPSFGTLSALFDGNLGNRCVWTAATCENTLAFWIKFDFGVGVTKSVNGMKQAGFDTASRRIAGATLQWSDDDSSWTTFGTVSGLTYPGDGTLSSLNVFT